MTPRSVLTLHQFLPSGEVSYHCMLLRKHQPDLWLAASLHWGEIAKLRAFEALAEFVGLELGVNVKERLEEKEKVAPEVTLFRGRELSYWTGEREEE